MRICTITCQNADNYGARLQAYALAEYLRSKGHHVNVIDYRPPYMTFKTHKWFWPNSSLKEWAKLFLQMERRSRDIRRHAAFDAFSAKYLPLTTVYNSMEELKENPPTADIYIAGSDQIWNTEFANGTDPAYYLDFGADNIKRISYAASFASLSIVTGKEHFVKTHLGRFDEISVRESSALSILRSLGRKGIQVVDPVFLLSAEKWDKLTADNDCECNYILVYDFMDSKAIKQIALKLAGIHKCKILSIGSRRLRYADKNFLTAGPDRFLQLVKHATCVLSNSYHGTAFAMIFKRDFFVVRREDGLNERMADWLACCKLSSRMIDGMVSDEELVSHIDYANVCRTIEEKVIQSKRFLDACCSSD